ncbi:uncharacterized protein ACHE_31076A [Aspergillus chevalieri]|uniref:Uncharacterized protein n=1 Tax=Aspergillus chevalieri TaxID=182096 RepID=A0A7R7VM59_ASPCH|nr:uncharacterized protein ACHE_31076A [Aspergillus chevalieri]BCR87089.1 hypothetical protein ACHE_31076A [Aspergillus chevalieri]
MANLAVWSTYCSSTCLCPSINLNGLKNLQSPVLKNISMQPCGTSQLTSHPTEMYSRGALVLPIKSTSSNPETAYPHALISATNRLAERFPCCVPSHYIPPQFVPPRPRCQKDGCQKKQARVRTTANPLIQ